MNKLKKLSTIFGVIGIICIATLIIYLMVKPSIDTNTKPQGPRESLTVEEIKSNLPVDKYGECKCILQDTHYKETDFEDDDYEYTKYYYEKFSHPFIEAASVTIVSSGIEDGMIYTNTVQVDENGHELEILYINDPDTLELVAMGVRADYTRPSEFYSCETVRENWYKLYTFMDKNGYTWYDKHSNGYSEEE